MTIAFPTRIETERLVFRPPQPQDAEAIFTAYAQDPAVCRFMLWPPHTSVAVTREFVTLCLTAWEKRTGYPYVLTEKATGEVLGMIEARPLELRVTLGYVLAQSHWGRGLMPEAIRALTGTALLELGYFRVQATCDIANIPSARALEKSGFTREARLARYTVHPNVAPEPRDSWLYARWR